MKNSIGNVEPKELICKTHGHELRATGMLEGRMQAEGDKREEKKKKNPGQM